MGVHLDISYSHDGLIDSCSLACDNFQIVASHCLSNWQPSRKKENIDDSRYYDWSIILQIQSCHPRAGIWGDHGHRLSYWCSSTSCFGTWSDLRPFSAHHAYLSYYRLPVSSYQSGVSPLSSLMREVVQGISKVTLILLEIMFCSAAPWLVD